MTIFEGIFFEIFEPPLATDPGIPNTANIFDGVMPSELDITQFLTASIPIPGPVCVDAANRPDEFYKNDYTINTYARALFEYNTNNGTCTIQQAPFSMGIPGVIRLRTKEKAPYTNQKSSIPYNISSSIDYPLGKT